MLVTSIFSFSHNVFYPIKGRNYHLCYIYFVCKCFQFGQSQIFVIGEWVKSHFNCNLQMVMILDKSITLPWEKDVSTSFQTLSPSLVKSVSLGFIFGFHISKIDYVVKPSLIPLLTKGSFVFKVLSLT